jgi:hypothetical protein
MTDVLERLRAANPVADCDPPPAERLWPAIDAAPPRRRRHHPTAVRVAAGVLAVVLVALAVGLASGGSGPTSIAARAYAATGTPGVIDHFVEISRTHRAPGAPPFGYADSRAEVWFSGSRSHALTTSYMVSARGHRSIQGGEEAVDGLRAMTYNADTNTSATLNLRPAGVGQTRSCIQVLVCGWEPANPIATLRELYAAGRLHDAGTTTADGRRLDVLAGGTGRPPGPRTLVRILVDPKTFIPVKLVVTMYGALGRSPVALLLTTETTIGDYERIPLTPATSRLLAMRAHPGAQPICALRRVSPPPGSGVLAPC